MSGYHYIRSEPGLWTVGIGETGADWEPESDHGSVREAAARTAYLNGGPDPDAEPVDDGLHALVAQLAELTEVLRPVAARLAADVEISPAGRDQGAPSVEPGEAVSPAVATTGQPGDQPVDERAEQIAGLREMADWLEANPEVPLAGDSAEVSVYAWQASGAGLAHFDDDVAQAAELRRVAELIGAELTVGAPGGPHGKVAKKFRGGAKYGLWHVWQKPQAADETLLGVGEVAGPVAGPATALAEEVRQAEQSELDQRDMAAAPLVDALGIPATSPRVLSSSKHASGFRAPEVVAELEREDPTEVWMAVRRRGINYHDLTDGGGQTACGRDTGAGLRLPLAEARTLDCPRCPVCHRKSEG